MDFSCPILHAVPRNLRGRSTGQMATLIQTASRNPLSKGLLTSEMVFAILILLLHRGRIPLDSDARLFQEFLESDTDESGEPFREALLAFEFPRKPDR